MTVLMRYSLMLMITFPSLAIEVTHLPPPWMKVTREKNPKCVEYALINAELG